MSNVRFHLDAVHIQLERLKRHYQVSLRTYDPVSLLDLSHALRIWVELKDTLPKLAPKFATTLAFRTAIPAKKAFRSARGAQYVFAYMPGGVITYASKGHIASAPDRTEKGKPFFLGAAAKAKSDGSLELKNYCMIQVDVSDELLRTLIVAEQTRCNYANWLGAEAVRVCFTTDSGELRPLAISREMLVKRVANTLDGSHPSSGVDQATPENSFDAAVKCLLEFRMGGLPLPYFILLKIAQDIISTVPRLLGLPEVKSET